MLSKWFYLILVSIFILFPTHREKNVFLEKEIYSTFVQGLKIKNILNLSYFISKRISSSDNIRKGAFSSIINRIAIISIALGLAVMIVSFSILFGFQNTVKEKLYSFSAHLQITKFTLSHSLEEIPVATTNDFYQDYSDYNLIDYVQQFALKAGLIRTDDEILGVVLKGVGQDFDYSKFESNMVEGEFIQFDSISYSKDVVLSKIIANKLNIKVNDDITVHFFQNPPRARKLTVKGIYETNLSEYFDDKVIIGDIDLIRRLNDWPDTLAGGFEVYLKDAESAKIVEQQLDDDLPLDLYVEKVSDKFIQVFEWLHLIRRQVNIFLGLILFVVCFNMISVILILIMERTQMIGILKALGAENGLIRKIFNYTGMRIVAKGLLLGNSIAIGLCALQYYVKIIPLNPKDYYMSYVPISWDLDVIILLNVLTFLVVSFILAISTIIITRIQPIKAIQFD